MKNIVNTLNDVDLDSGLTNTESTRRITAHWDGKPYCLCHGEWIITVGGEKIDLPDDVRTHHMNTHGMYRQWHFGGESGWDEIWTTYEDGLRFPEWIKENQWWLKDLHLSDSEIEDLYDAISEEDWRHGSCGGCI